MVEFKKKTQTAVELLFDFNNKIDLVLKYIQNIDNNQKVMLNNINSLIKKQDIIKNENDKSQTNSNLISSKESIKQAKDSLLENVRRVQRNVPIIQENENRINVVQQIMTKTNKPVYLASVEIFDLQDNLISKTRTKSNGKWQASLNAGEYKISITKRAPIDSGKESVSSSYIVIVDGSEKIIEFEPHILKEGN